ncbi:oxidoreductase [Paenibacillus baekrokdamisoli]|uniref:Oxidoreductase n=1 Tax=Paenibacillus baekrokdamisoli TaxID=1712516 RepID=A0A3G9JEU9_9BACL|nr:Gfo/Idh/MocA family oxidoreductase [Paenibacillus baekrokdamisoli]MBB3068661.1 putative dehydrogenase [Paenibacillus baekrokdamisoli]BBH23493.1 oxidoreductase [Paenibacillus baekrokdamisoli]
MKKIRLGIIGCGGIANSGHAKGLIQLNDIMTFTAACDHNLERAEHMAGLVQAEKAVTDYRDMLDDVDAVLIALPHDLHYEVGLACLKAGKHVLMEKPLANTEEECAELIRTAEAMDRVLMTAYPVPFWPVIEKMKELIDSKAYGDIFQLSIWTEQLTYAEEGHWTHSAKRLGGGQLFSHGCHYINLMLRFLGKPIKGVHMGTNLGTPWMEKEGTSNVTIEFENGVMGYHFGTWGARGSRLGYSIHAHCTEGMLDMHLGEGKLYAYSHMKREQGDLETGSSSAVVMEIEEPGKMTQHETRHFLECIASGKRPIVDGPRSIQGLRVIWRLYEAEQNNAIADLRGLGLDEEWDNPALRTNFQLV